MATALGDLIEEVLLNLEGYIEDQDVFGTLQGSITNSAMTFTVNGATFPDGSGFSPGIVEIGDELVYVQAIDRDTGVFSGCLRGWRGTTAVAWPAGTLVRNNPRLPRMSVKRALNDTIESLYPRVYVVKTTEFTYQGSRLTYDLPADCREVSDVSWLEPGSSGLWVQARRWRLDRDAASSSATGRTLELYDAQPGRTVKVTYEAEPATLTLLADVFTTVSGLPSWCKEIVVLGACWRLLANLDAGNVGSRSAEQRLVNGQAPLGSGVQVAKQYAQMFELRLQQAEARLRQEHDVRIRYTS